MGSHIFEVIKTVIDIAAKTTVLNISFFSYSGFKLVSAHNSIGTTLTRGIKESTHCILIDITPPLIGRRYNGSSNGYVYLRVFA